MFQTIDHKMDRTYELPLINQSCQLERDLHEYRYFESTFSPRNGQVFHRLKQPSLEHVHRLDAFVSRVSTRIFRPYSHWRSEERRVGKESTYRGIRDRNVTGVQTCALPISTNCP